jgi:alpha-glucosidase
VDKDLLETYRRLIALRRSTPALRHGGCAGLHAGDDAVAYLRETADQRVLVLLAGAHMPGPPSGLLVDAGVAPTSLYGDASLTVRDERGPPAR